MGASSSLKRTVAGVCRGERDRAKALSHMLQFDCFESHPQCPFLSLANGLGSSHAFLPGAPSSKGLPGELVPDNEMSAGWATRKAVEKDFLPGAFPQLLALPSPLSFLLGTSPGHPLLDVLSVSLSVF